MKACWGAGRTNGSKQLYDPSSKERLSSTHRYVECCFQRLRRLVDDKEPAWMEKLLRADLAPWAG